MTLVVKAAIYGDYSFGGGLRNGPLSKVRPRVRNFWGHQVAPCFI